jgi:hypothetical protein
VLTQNVERGADKHNKKAPIPSGMRALFSESDALFQASARPPLRNA